MEIERVTVELITILVGDDARLEMTPARARELYDVLGQLFGNSHPVYLPIVIPATPVPEYPFAPTVTWRLSPGYVSDAHTGAATGVICAD